MSAVQTNIDVQPIALSYRDAATALGLTYGSLRMLIHKGRGPRTIALGKQSRIIRIIDIEAWLAERALATPVGGRRQRGRPRKTDALTA